MTLIFEKDKYIEAIKTHYPDSSKAKSYMAAAESCIELEPFIDARIRAVLEMLANNWKCSGDTFRKLAAQLEATPPEPVKLNPCVKCGRPFNVVSEYKNYCECGNSTKWFKKESDADAAWNAANPVTPERKDGE